MTYKPEIDGLRAIAVLAVVLFHFNVQALSGGFVGVDIFFVISGYLITSIMAEDLARGAFTFREFYARRARRILPASTVVLMAVAIFGWSKVDPSDLVVLGKSLVATVGFASNFFFYKQTDYFGADGHTLHLLHTWSLAVEEQFYVFFPLLMFGLRNAPRERAFRVVALIACASFALSLVGTWQAPSLTFYMLPSRAWELLIGSLIALRTPRMRSVSQASLFTILGMTLIAVALFVADGDVPFPGFVALAPTLGAALILVAGPHAASPLRSALGNRVMVGIGKISYSMYLWHWPMAVIHAGTKDLEYPAWMLLAPLFVLSYLSYRVVEQPFRNPQWLPTKTKLALALGSSLTLVLFGIVAIKTHGMEFDLDAAAVRILEAPEQDHVEIYGGNCFHDRRKPWSEFPIDECLSATAEQRTVLIWGDSLAAHYVVGIKTAAAKSDIHVLQATQASCPAGLGHDWKQAPHCKEQNEGVLAHVRKHHPDLVVLSGNWHPERRSQMGALQKLLDELDRLRLPTVLLGPAIAFKKSLPNLLVAHMRVNKPFNARRSLHRGAAKTDADFKAALNLRQARLVSLYDLMCPRWKCPALTPEGSPLVWDARHLTRDGSILVGKELFPVVEEELHRARGQAHSSERGTVDDG